MFIALRYLVQCFCTVKTKTEETFGLHVNALILRKKHFLFQMFIRALFDYDPNEDKAIPCKEAGLAFRKGDILQIMSQDDATWWQAKHEGDANPRAGLIPSKHFQER